MAHRLLADNSRSNSQNTKLDSLEKTFELTIEVVQQGFYCGKVQVLDGCTVQVPEPW